MYGTTGFTTGGGICLVMTCDLMVSADTTKFMYPEAKVGVFGGLMPGIVSRMPHKVAMELLLLGEEISVKRAYDVGFVNKVVPLKDVQTLVDKLKTQKGITIDQRTIEGANHFFEGKVEELMGYVENYVDMRIAMSNETA